MSRLDEGRLLAYLDEELEPGDRAEAEAWLAESPDALEALEAIRQRRARVADALGMLGPPDAEVRAARERVESRLRERRRGSGAFHRSHLSRAALAVLFLGAAGVSAAVPGSPIRAWLGLDGAEPERAAAGPAAEAASGLADEMGLRVRPVEGALHIVLTGVSGGREVVVRLVDDANGAVYAPRASFRSGSGRIDAAVAAGDEPVRVEIPHSASEATLRVDGRVFLEKRGERLDFPGPAGRVSGDTIRFGG